MTLSIQKYQCTLLPADANFCKWKLQMHQMPPTMKEGGTDEESVIKIKDLILLGTPTTVDPDQLIENAIVTYHVSKAR